MKNLWPKILGAVVCIVLGWTGSNVYHGIKNRAIVEHNELLSAAVNALEAARAQERAQYEEELGTLRGMVTSAGTIIADLEEDIEARDDEIEAQDSQIAALKTAEVQELIERYPALKEFTLALEGQVATQKQQIIDLRAVIAQKDIQIIGLENMLEIKDEIIYSVTQDYLGEKALRIQTQKDFADYRQEPGPASIWTKALYTGIGYGLAKITAKVF
jgi:chromosome segregation ATPase